jgi:carbonic anhydrase/acetyltransferase-like protein (isoleucine patch superfamily)
MAVTTTEVQNDYNSDDSFKEVLRNSSSSRQVNSVSEISRIDTSTMFVTVSENGTQRHFERHINKYADVVGGFVEKTAHVDDSAYLDRWSTVEDNALVSGDVKVICSRIRGAAEIEGCVEIYVSEIRDGAKIYGGHDSPSSKITISHSNVWESATIRGNALIDRAHVFGSVVIEGDSVVRSSSVSGDMLYKNLRAERKVMTDKALSYFNYMAKRLGS